jgi:hypothetical protein
MTTDNSSEEQNSSWEKTLSVFQTISQQLSLLISITEKMLEAQTQYFNNRPEEVIPPDTLSLLTLPSSLRKTVMALYKLQKATADGIAAETKRLRGMESAWANQLVRMGYVKKTRQGRKVYFYIESAPEIKK